MQVNLSTITLNKFKAFYDLSQVSDNNDIETSIQLIHILTDKSVAEIEELELDEFKAILNSVNYENTDTSSLPVIIEYKANDKVYKSTNKDTFNFNVKQINLLQGIIKANANNYIEDLAAIIFKPIDEAGNIINDYSDEAIAQRKQELSSVMTMNILIPYLNLLHKQFK